MNRVLFFLTAIFVLNLPAAHAGGFSSEEKAKSYYNRGTESYEKGDFAAAVSDLSAALALEPKAPDAYYNRGLSYRRQHRNDEAIADFSQAIALYPFQPSYFLSRCNARIVQNDLDGAIEDASKAIDFLPDEARGYFMRGLAHMLRGDLDEALSDSVRALQIEPAQTDARRLLYETLVKREMKLEMRYPSAPRNAYLTAAPKEA